jgi:pilus assembly protein TadC
VKIILIILFLLIVASVGFGFYIKPENYTTGEFCIGIGIAALFFLWMPLFIYHRWSKRNFKDYMLTKENIDKMREEADDKKY